MNQFTTGNIVVLFLSIAFMLGLGKFFGEIFRYFKLPSVIGEILAGILIGPSFMGKFFPAFYDWIFPRSGLPAVALDAFILLGIVLFLLIAGLEVDLNSLMEQGRSVIWASLFNIVIPFSVGMIFPLVAPGFFNAADNRAVLPLFIGVALSITALPVIAKILMDMKLIRTRFGMLVIVSAMINDVFGWIFFSIIVQLSLTGIVSIVSIAKITGITIAVALFILFGVRLYVNCVLPWIQKNTEWPGGVIVFVIVIGLLCSALTEVIGIHAIFGAFCAGIAVGTSRHLSGHTREIIHHFISNIFAPLFFVSIGLRVDFIQKFNPGLVIVLILLAFAVKIAGSLVGGKISGLTLRESLPVGFAMSARGAMEIIIGMLALQYRMISDETFVAFVIMAIVTSLLCAPLIKIFLKPEPEEQKALS